MAIELDFETAGRIVIAALKEDYNLLKEDMQKYADKIAKAESLEDYEIRNISNNSITMNAIKVVLEYYMTSGEAAEFFKS